MEFIRKVKVMRDREKEFEKYGSGKGLRDKARQEVDRELSKLLRYTND